MAKRFSPKAATLLLASTSLAPLGMASLAAAAEMAPDTIIVEGRRAPSEAAERIFGTVTLGPEQLASQAQPLLDDVLRQLPGVDLFRRTSSKAAHPTTQGLSVRGIGPNGAGRVLVLVDDVPANDPFGGWTYWTRLPTSSIGSVAVTEGGGAGPWGNVALAGTLRVRTRALEGAEVAGGSDGTWDATTGATAAAGNWTFGAIANYFRTDGFKIVRADQRGPVDIDAWTRSKSGQVNATYRADGTSAVLTLGGFQERRGNGTPLLRNGNDQGDVSLRVSSADGPFGGAVHGTAYFKLVDFFSTFNSVPAGRATEALSLDQYDVPASGAGLSVDAEVPWNAQHNSTVGVDVRYAEGATHELFTLVNNAFTRDREAGGRQVVGGAFLEHGWHAAPDLDIQAGVRVDRWQNDEGRRIERILATNVAARDDRFASRSGWVATARGGAVWRVDPSVELRGTVYTGFRIPTLNELYRPFRVGNDQTEANPTLRPERLFGADIGAAWTPVPGAKITITGFRTELRNAVDNVLISNTPGFIPEFNFTVIAGGSLIQRRNLDLVTVQGIESSIDVELGDSAVLTLRHLYNDGVITRGGTGAARLDGKRPGQTPRHGGSASLAWKPVDSLTLRVTGRASSTVFEDSDNSRTMAPYVVADAFAGWRMTQNVELFASISNLFDRTVETGKRADGLTNVGAPRQWLLGARFTW